MLREPVVSGTFYPEGKKAAEEMISSFAGKKPIQTAARGAVLPHAGYVYSGQVAAATISRIIPRKKVVILGPNHTGLGEQFSLFPEGSWQTPLGGATVDSAAASLILSRQGPIKADIAAHQFEHSIEVELPLLQFFFKDFVFLPICCKTGTHDDYLSAAGQLFEALKEFKDELIVIASSDMTHYEPDQTARKKDRIAIESILRLDEQELLKKIRKEQITMCGAAPVAIMLSLTKMLGARKAEVIKYQTSGDTSGDYTAVVGYLGAIIT